jgi:hypothetical protein
MSGFSNVKMSCFATWEVIRGRELPYKVFDRLSQIRQADIINSKRLGSVLTMAREAQLASNERRSKSCPSRPFPTASSMQ